MTRPSVSNSGNLSSIADRGGSNPSNRAKGPKNVGSRGAGKYRQRNRTHQLLEGMSSLAGLDIDLTDDASAKSDAERETKSNQFKWSADNRKMNLSHMINRKFERQSTSGRPASHSQSRNRAHPNIHYKDNGSGHKFSKQQFLQANCQFVVLDGYDYSIHRVNPDWPIDWNHIEEIKFKQCASTETTCPICLESPIAAKITKCGHIYCWTCMLHYLSLSDEKCRPCPICFEYVYRNDLRSVVSHSFIGYSVDAEISMRLMIRKKGFIIVEPFRKKPAYEGLKYELNQENYWSQDNLFIVDTETVIDNVIKRESEELSRKLNGGEEIESCFIEQALELLNQRKESLRNQNPRQLNSQAGLTVQGNSSLFDSYLFYQCLDGQHIYLNPFSTKILCHEYGNLENCPQEICAKIIQMDWISMSEAWRKRFRYLSHLPLSCEFRLIEIDFEKSNLVSPETLRFFSDQIKSREKERERLRKEERKRDKIIQIEQDRKIYGIQPSLKININNPDQFPSVSDERYIGLSIATDHSCNDGFFASSDEEEEQKENQQQLDQTNVVNHNTRQADSEASLGVPPQEVLTEPLTSVTISFRDIQLQEEASVSALNNKAKTNTGPWGQRSKKSIESREQGASTSCSSFAQLLVNAKDNKEKWKVINSPRAVVDRQVNSSASVRRQHKESAAVSDDEEELRAPAANLTISDFIDLNVVKNVNTKRRGKQKVATGKRS